MATVTCPNCGEAVVSGDQFCEACGVDLPTEVATAERPADAPPGLSPEHEAGFTELVRVPGMTCHCGGRYREGWCDTCGDKQPDPRDHLEVDHGGLLGAVTDKGLRYPRNEDGMALHVPEDPSGLRIAVVCDGVSSTVDPHLASQAASNMALQHLLTTPEDLVGAHRVADDAVRAIDWVPKPEHGSPSCTFLAATVRDRHVRVASLGDCRAYWIPDQGPPTLVTNDDSWAQEQADAGVMTLQEALSDRRAHVITRWLGRDADPRWEPLVVELQAEQPGVLVLCSDGLWNYAEAAAVVAEQVAKAGSGATPVEVARHLVQFALDAGGHDNVTVACLPIPADLPAIVPTPAEPEHP